MFDEVLISGDRARRLKGKGDTGDHLSFKVRLPWYRSVYISCLNRLDLRIDDQQINAEDVLFKLYGTTYHFNELEKFHAVLWFILDEAEILVPARFAKSDGDQCNIALKLFIRIPYHRASTFQQVSTCERTLPIEARVSL